MNRYKLHIPQPQYPTIEIQSHWVRNDLPQDYHKKLTGFIYPEHIHINKPCTIDDSTHTKPCWSVCCSFSTSLHLSEEEIHYLYRPMQ